MASPEDGVVRTEEELEKDEPLDFESVCFDGNVPIWKPPKSAKLFRIDERKKRKIAPTLTHREVSSRVQFI